MKKYSIAAIFSVVILFISSISFAQETITITTYYPSPNGVYGELIVTDRMAVGDVNGDGVVNNLDLPRDAAGNPFHNALAVANSLNNRLSVGDVNGDGLIDAEDLGRDAAGNPLNGTLTVANSIGVGTNTPQGALDVVSTTAGFIPPRMNTAQRNAINPPIPGMIIFNTDTGRLEVFDPVNGWVGVGGISAVTTVIKTGCWWGGTHQLTATCPAGWRLLSCAGGPGDQLESMESYHLQAVPALGFCIGQFRQPACWGAAANQQVYAICGR